MSSDMSASRPPQDQAPIPKGLDLCKLSRQHEVDSEEAICGPRYLGEF